MIAPEQRKLLPFGGHPEMLPMLEGQLRVLEDNIQRENQIITHIDQGIGQQTNLLSTDNLVSEVENLCMDDLQWFLNYFLRNSKSQLYYTPYCF